MNTIVYPNESYRIIGAILEVHNRLGIGLMEKVYQEALEKEFIFQKIPYEREKKYELYYRGVKMDAYYISDFVCYDKIIVEIKAVSEILDVHRAQLRNCLSLAKCKLGILANFNELFMNPQRIINSGV